MKKFIFGILILLYLFPSIVSAKIPVYFFHGDGCPHCEDEKKVLKRIKVNNPDVEVISYEVWYDEENASLLESVKDSLHLKNPYVPFTVIGETGITGFNSGTELEINDAIEFCRENICDDVVKEIEKSGSYTGTPVVTSTRKLPILGKVDLKQVSLPLVSIILGFIDGFNPCAMWILVFLITLLLGTHDRKKMIILGVTFLTISGLIYFLFLTAWFELTISLKTIIWLRNIIALFAILFGGYQLFTYFKTKETGCHVVNSKRRTILMEHMRKLVSKRSMMLSLLGIITLAITVNLVELACSAGLPVLFTQILSINEVTGSSAFFLFFLYVIFYMIDDVVIFLLAMKALKITGITNRYSRVIHLLGGTILFIMGLLLLLKPEWILLSF